MDPGRQKRNLQRTDQIGNWNWWVVACSSAVARIAVVAAGPAFGLDENSPDADADAADSFGAVGAAVAVAAAFHVVVAAADLAVFPQIHVAAIDIHAAAAAAVADGRIAAAAAAADLDEPVAD